MDYQRSKALLKKINVLHDSAIDFEGSMTSMERDLLLQYLRDLYDTILDDGQSTQTPSNRIKREPSVAAAPAPIAAPAPVQRVAEPVKPVAQVIETEKVTVPQELPAKEEIKPEGGKKKERLAQLFQSNDAQDLRSRFGALPISDIGKSMGINDKILTINELFGGDQGLFSSVVGELNNFKSFDKAQEYLIGGVAKKQGWYEEDKKDKATTFIKLIRRRYI
jgi:hypothetical protein